MNVNGIQEADGSIPFSSTIYPLLSLTSFHIFLKSKSTNSSYAGHTSLKRCFFNFIPHPPFYRKRSPIDRSATPSAASIDRLRTLSLSKCRVNPEHLGVNTSPG
jgi:hypothetical protein